jgi:hypothetical protein
MRRLRIVALLGALMMLVASTGLVSAQVAYGTPFATSITYQNVGNANTTVQFSFFGEKSASPVVVSREIAANAGSSLFVGGLTGTEALPSGFKGSAVLSASQPVVATLVQIAQPGNNPVRNRPLSNGFRESSSNVLLATVLKNRFNYNSICSIQNAESNSNIDITLRFFDADNPGNPPIELTEQNIPPGSAKYYDIASPTQFPTQFPNVFNGSATVTAVRSGGSQAAQIVGSCIEMQTNGVGTYAFEGITQGNPNMFVATALCNAFGGNSTSYAVQNVDPSTAANVTVTYRGINTQTNAQVTQTASATINPGAKNSFVACNANVGDNFSGAATISSNVPIVVIAKVFGSSRSTAWLGEAQGSSKLALPYVRYSSDANFATGNFQRTFIAVQNVASSAVNNVVIEYRDKNGGLVGTHTIASIAAGEKANSNATLATPAAGKTAADLLNFGNPESNPGGGFGGAAMVVGPAGSQLIAVARVETRDTFANPNVTVAEDYNGLAIQ